MEEVLVLLKENNELLKKIIARLDLYDSVKYRESEDMRAFLINVTADMFVEVLNDNLELKNKILGIFKGL